MKLSERIWIQSDEEHGEPTFCEDKINVDDVEYVRADLFAQLEAELAKYHSLDRAWKIQADEYEVELDAWKDAYAERDRSYNKLEAENERLNKVLDEVDEITKRINAKLDALMERE